MLHYLYCLDQNPSKCHANGLQFTVQQDLFSIFRITDATSGLEGRKDRVVYQHIGIVHGGRIVFRIVEEAEIGFATEAPKATQRAVFISPYQLFRHDSNEFGE